MLTDYEYFKSWHITMSVLKNNAFWRNRDRLKCSIAEHVGLWPQPFTLRDCVKPALFLKIRDLVSKTPV